MRGSVPLHSPCLSGHAPLSRYGHHSSQPTLLLPGSSQHLAHGYVPQSHGHLGQPGTIGQPTGFGQCRGSADAVLRPSSPPGRQMVQSPRPAVLQGLLQPAGTPGTPGTPAHPCLQPTPLLHVEAPRAVFPKQHWSAASWPGQSQASAEWRGAECSSPRSVHFADGRHDQRAEPLIVRQSSAPQPGSPDRTSSVDRFAAAFASQELSPRTALTSSASMGALRSVLRFSSAPRTSSPRQEAQLDAGAEVCSMETPPQKSVMPRARLHGVKTKEPRGGSPRDSSPCENRLSRPRGAKRDEAARRGPVKVTEEDFRQVSRPLRERIGTFDKAGVTQQHSPREDRVHGGSLRAPRRNASQPNLVSELLLLRAQMGDEDASVQTALQAQKELEDARQENTRLQDKLAKAKSLVLLLQKQADEARSERDREQQRSEGLQLSVQQLQRQLRREGARSQQLERQLCAALSANSCTGLERESVCENAPSGNVSSAVAHGAMAKESSIGRGHSNQQPSPYSEERAADKGEHDGLDQTRPAPPQTQDQVRSDPCSREAFSMGGFERSWEFVVQGQHNPEEQHDFAPKLVSCFPEDAVERAWSRGVACVCARGRRQDVSVPNQDDFLIARHTLANEGHIALYGIFDGHGPAGHHCAAFMRGSLPESLFGQHTLLMKPEDTLRLAFRQTQQHLLEQPFDTETSGTTAALALVLNIPGPPGSDALAGDVEQHSEGEVETWLFVAHVGDSRIILASHKEADPSAFSVTTLTRDHRPDDKTEADRIRRESQDGDVRKTHGKTGAMRVFSQSQNRSVSALTRSLGASGAAGCGVISEPEISAYRLRPDIDVLLLLGSDGLFEFCSNAEAVSRVLQDGITVAVLEEICGDAREQWAQNSSNETVDDITAIAVSLTSSQSRTLA